MHNQPSNNPQYKPATWPHEPVTCSQFDPNSAIMRLLLLQRAFDEASAEEVLKQCHPNIARLFLIPVPLLAALHSLGLEDQAQISDLQRLWYSTYSDFRKSPPLASFIHFAVTSIRCRNENNLTRAALN